MPVQALTQIDPQQFFNLSSANGARTQRLDTRVSGVAGLQRLHRPSECHDGGRRHHYPLGGSWIRLPRSELQVPR